MTETEESYWKTYYDKNKDKVCERNKQWRINNATYISDSHKKYWKDKCEEIKKKRKEILSCPTCNVSVTRESMSRHKKSKKHLKIEPTELKSIDTI